MKIIIVVFIKSVPYARHSAKFFTGLSFNHYNNLISCLFFIFFNLQTRTQIQRQKRNFSEVTQLVGSGAEIWKQVSDSQDPTLSTGLYPFLAKSVHLSFGLELVKVCAPAQAPAYLPHPYVLGSPMWTRMALCLCLPGVGWSTWNPIN